MGRHIRKGSVSGDPHMGSHTWPEINNSIITIADDDKWIFCLRTQKQNCCIKVGTRLCMSGKTS